MNITHVITGLDRGGAEAMLVRLATGMDGRRFRNRVISILPPGALAAELERAGIEVDCLDMVRPRQAIAGLAKLVRLLREQQPDLVQSWLYHADLMATLATARTGHRLAWNLRCSDMDLTSYSRHTAQVRWLLARLSARPVAVIVNSSSGRDFHAGIGYHPRRWELLPNGIDTRRFAPDPDARAALSAVHRIPASGLLVGHVARFDTMKDHAGFIAAAGRLRSRLPELHVVMAGRGVDADNAVLTGALAEAGIADITTLLGELDDVAPLLAALDLHVLSSAFGEGFPNVVGEAMASGVPCVVTDVGDAAWLVGATGRAVAARDPGALAAAMADILERPLAERSALAGAARARVVEAFDMAAIACRYEQLYAELAVR